MVLYQDLRHCALGSCGCFFFGLLLGMGSCVGGVACAYSECIRCMFVLRVFLCVVPMFCFFCFCFVIFCVCTRVSGLVFMRVCVSCLILVYFYFGS